MECVVDISELESKLPSMIYEELCNMGYTKIKVIPVKEIYGYTVFLLDISYEKLHGLSKVIEGVANSLQWLNETNYQKLYKELKNIQKRKKEEKIKQSLFEEIEHILRTLSDVGFSKDIYKLVDFMIPYLTSSEVKFLRDLLFQYRLNENEIIRVTRKLDFTYGPTQELEDQLNKLKIKEKILKEKIKSFVDSRIYEIQKKPIRMNYNEIEAEIKKELMGIIKEDLSRELQKIEEVAPDHFKKISTVLWYFDSAHSTFYITRAVKNIVLLMNSQNFFDIIGSLLSYELTKLFLNRRNSGFRKYLKNMGFTWTSLLIDEVISYAIATEQKWDKSILEYYLQGEEINVSDIVRLLSSVSMALENFALQFKQRM